MPDRRYRHIIVNRPPRTDSYTSNFSGGSGSRSPSVDDPALHGQRLKDLLETATQKHDQNQTEVTRIEGSIKGVYIEFESEPGFELALKSLDRSSGIELRRASTAPEKGQTTSQTAVVFVPEEEVQTFYKIFDQYINDRWPATGKPINNTLVSAIGDLKLATVEKLWSEETDFPNTDQPVWWEVWLRRRHGEVDRFDRFVETVGGETGRRRLVFRDRVIVLYRGTARQLSQGLDLFDDLAELRRPPQTFSFLSDLPPSGQYEWVDDLVRRLSASTSANSSICVLDTGIDESHPLLAPATSEENCHSVIAGTKRDTDGHGTSMAGLSLYGDIGELLASDGPVQLASSIESVKIFSQSTVNDPDSYGAITAQAVSTSEISEPQQSRVFVMAVTEDNNHERRRPHIPTAWSATLDALAAGRSVDLDENEMIYIDEQGSEPRLFIVSAGNVDRENYEADYLDRCTLEAIENPAQAWNVLTVGAYTCQQTLDDSDFEGWTPLAENGDISPTSRTSTLFDDSWPYKPDVVLEGGNTAVSPDGKTIDTPPSLQILATRSRHKDNRPLTSMVGTSPAAASAAYLAASLQNEYETLWPESIRGLIVNSARWTPHMQSQLDKACKASDKKTQISKLLRLYGWGVPDHERARKSASDSVTLVAQDVIHPYHEGAMGEIKYHDLPWPRQALLDLGETVIEMRVTLSYFVEPNPSRRGWEGRYRYPSHELRFAMRYATETTEYFRKRCNKESLDKGEKKPGGSDKDEWLLGSTKRQRGSITNDIWRGTAADLAERAMVAIYPSTGWWKDQPKHDRSDNGVRYSLIISIDSPETEIDLWTPIVTANQTPIEIRS